MAFGDIYLADFDPSVGHEYKNKRPAIVIQEESLSATAPYATILPMTSKLEKRGGVDIFVEKDGKNNLANNSIIRVRHISTFDQTRLIHFIGRAGSPAIRQVRGYLRRHFGM